MNQVQINKTTNQSEIFTSDAGVFGPTQSQSNMTGAGVYKSSRSFSDIGFGNRGMGRTVSTSNINRGRVIMNAAGQNGISGSNPSDDYINNLNQQ